MLMTITKIIAEDYSRMIDAAHPVDNECVSSFPLSKSAPCLESRNDVTPDLQPGHVFFDDGEAC